MAHVAKTIAAVAAGHSRLLTHILDRTTPITSELVDNVMSLSQCHYAGRRPRKPGTSRTDMDLASYLLATLRREAVVEIESYKRLTTKHSPDDVRHVGERRFGKLTGLVSHSEYLSFGITLNDVSVIGGDETPGQERSFTLVDPCGNWHVEPEKLSWRERDDEAAFNALHKLSLSKITRFTHSNRRESVMGAPYLIAKLLLERLKEEYLHYRRPAHSGDVIAPATASDQLSVIVPSFTMKLKGPERHSQYLDLTSSSYQEQLRRWRQLVQWLVRINEYAFYLDGMVTNYTAPWVKDQAWHATGEGRAVLALHPKLVLSYTLSYRSRAVRVATC